MLSEEMDDELDENGANKLALDKEWLATFIQELEEAITKVKDEKKKSYAMKKEALDEKLTLMK